MIHIKNGDWVMVKIPESQHDNKLQPIYEGPYRVVHRNKDDSTYVLKDEMNELLHREHAPYELKVVSVDEPAIEDEMYEVDCILAHSDLLIFQDDDDGRHTAVLDWTVNKGKHILSRHNTGLRICLVLLFLVL
jgi:hypothetical protein